MIDLKTACKIVCDANPGYKPTLCLELKKYYLFNMNSKFADSTVHLVDKKTGKYKMKYFMAIIDEPVLRRYEEREINISK